MNLKLTPRIKIFFVFICTCIFWSVANSKTIIVLGDSLSEGYGVARESAWPALLEKKMNLNVGVKWIVINAGVSGSTTASGVARIKWLARKKPDAVILALGGNDGLRGLKVAESKKHLSDTISFAISKGIKVVLGGLYMPPNYGKEYTREFRSMYEDLAKKHSTIFVPFVLESVAGNPEYNLADGIHPNEKGHLIVSENIYKVIKGKL